MDRPQWIYDLLTEQGDELRARVEQEQLEAKQAELLEKMKRNLAIRMMENEKIRAEKPIPAQLTTSTFFKPVPWDQPGADPLADLKRMTENFKRAAGAMTQVQFTIPKELYAILEDANTKVESKPKKKKDKSKGMKGQHPRHVVIDEAAEFGG